MDRRDFLTGALKIAALGACSSFWRLGETFAQGSTATPQSPSPLKMPRTQVGGLDLPMLGYGLMRLPTVGDDKSKIDEQKAQALIDRAMSAGLNHFDTAYPYHEGASERFLGRALKKYPRQSYTISSKLPVRQIQTAKDAERIYLEQFQRIGADYFDYYLLHNLNAERFQTVKKLRLYEFLAAQKKAGKLRHIGFSVHDKPEVTRQIVETYPFDFALTQLNYLDWDLIDAKGHYDVLRSHNIPIWVMEPLRGGLLARLDEPSAAVLKAAEPQRSLASWAFRYLAGLPGIAMILSGMTEMAHLEDNLQTFNGIAPLNDAEKATLAEALRIFRNVPTVPCTACRYCKCVLGIPITDLFELYNQAQVTRDQKRFKRDYEGIDAKKRADACVGCGSCLGGCPQKIDIPKELGRVAEAYKAAK